MGTQITYTFADFNDFYNGTDCTIDESASTTKSTHPLCIKLDSGSPSNEKAIIMRPRLQGGDAPTAPAAHSLVLSSKLLMNITANSSTVDAPILVHGVAKNTGDSRDAQVYLRIDWEEYDVGYSWATAGAKGTADLYPTDGSATDFGLGNDGQRLTTIKTSESSGVRELEVNPSYWQGVLDGDYSNYGMKLSTETQGVSLTFDGTTGGVPPTFSVEYAPPLDMSSTGDFQCDGEHERSIEFVNVQNDSESGVGRAIALYGRGQRTWTFKATNHHLKSDTIGAIEWIQDYFEARKGSVEPFYAYVPNAGGAGTGGWDWVKVRFAHDKLATPTRYPWADAYSVQFSLREVID